MNLESLRVEPEFDEQAAFQTFIQGRSAAEVIAAQGTKGNEHLDQSVAQGLAARDSIILHHLPHLQDVASRIGRYSDFAEDLVSIGVLELLKMCDRYDPNEGATFRTYYQLRVEGEMRRAMGMRYSGKRNRHGAVILSDSNGLEADKVKSDTFEEPQEFAEKTFYAHQLEDAIRQLNEEERFVLEALFALNGFTDNPKNSVELAREFGITKEAISHRKAKILSKMKSFIEKSERDLRMSRAKRRGEVLVSVSQS